MNFRGRSRSQQNQGFQIAPMIDVIFLLLCFFIASQIFSQWETEIDVKLPTAETGRIPQRLPGEVIINVLQDGRLVVNRQSLTEEELASLLVSVVELFEGHPVLIRADQQTPYGRIIRVIDLCRQADIWNISFATVPTGAEATGAPAEG